MASRGRLRRTLLAALASGALVLSACAQGGDRHGEAAPGSPARVPDSTVELRPDGLGVVSLGAGADEVVALLTSLWGPPDLDTGWESGASSLYGDCPGRTRGAEWNHLAVLFSDGDTGVAPADRGHFFAWKYGEPALAFTWHGRPEHLSTPEGLTAGSTVADLRRVYGARLDIATGAVAKPSFSLGGSGEDLSGLLSGVGPTATVEVLAGGSPCGKPRLA